MDQVRRREMQTRRVRVRVTLRLAGLGLVVVGGFMGLDTDAARP